MAQGFNALHSRDGIDVWAVGPAGLIYRSFDGGSTWASRTVGTDALRGVATRGWVVHIVADNGKILRSTDSGGNYSTINVPGAPNLRGIQMIDDSIGYIVGGAGTILKTTDGGLNWTPQTSGVATSLNALKFLDASRGWVVGDAGVILATVDGGATWTPQTSGVSKDLYDVDVSEVGALSPNAWAVGKDATAVKTTDGGAAWTTVNLKIDSRADASAIWMNSASSIVMAGGGGFIRFSSNGGQTWGFRLHQLQGEVTDLIYYGANKVWVCNRSNRALMRSTDGGATWAFQTGLGTSRAFSLKQSLVSGSVRGSTLAQHPFNKNTFYGVLGGAVYKSQNRGETWTQISTIPSDTKTNAFFIAADDSNKMVAAVGTPDRIVRTTNGGGSWTDVFTSNFTEYGVPLEQDPNNPNRLLFGPEDGKIYESLDFGATWSMLSNPGFRSPCDIQIMPDSANVVWVGDGVTGSGQGQMFVSTNGASNFALNYSSTGSEVPMIAATRLDRGVGWSTHWSNGGVRRTKDFGASWPQVSTVSSAWGVDCARDDPNAMAFGVYSGGLIYLSFDQGTTFSTISATSSNYSVYLPDRNTVLIEQGTGIYKMATTYTYTPTTSQSVVVLAPNGGESYAAGSNQIVSFSGINIALARIEYRSAPGQPWQVLGHQTGYITSFNWTVPNDATTQAKIRVVDASDGAPVDSSNAFFTIQAPRAQVLTAGLDFGTRTVNTTTTRPVHIKASGTAPLVISNVTTTSGAYAPDRTSFTIPTGVTDSVMVGFTPPTPGGYPDTLVVTSNAPDSPHRIPLTGIGQAAPAVVVLVPNGGEAWQVGHLHDIEWSSAIIDSVQIEFQTAPAAPWQSVVAGIPTAGGTFNWLIPATPSSTVRVRILDLSGAVVDTSDADFSIIIPQIAGLPDTLDFGAVEVGTQACDTLTILNTGTAPLSITDISSSNPLFAAVRATMTIPPASSDTLTVCFDPDSMNVENAILTITSDDPGGPRTVALRGEGQAVVGVNEGAPRPAVFSLRQNRPNPFTGRTSIEYTLASRVMVHLEVFDLRGRRVALLAEGEQDPGHYSVEFGPGARTVDGQVLGQLPSGVYFYRLNAGAYHRTQRMMLVR